MQKPLIVEGLLREDGEDRTPIELLWPGSEDGKANDRVHLRRTLWAGVRCNAMFGGTTLPGSAPLPHPAGRPSVDPSSAPPDQRQTRVAVWTTATTRLLTTTGLATVPTV